MDKKLETLHKLCEALMEELEEYGKKIEKADGMSAGDLEAVDKLSHALKSVKTTIAMMEAGDEEGGYSERYMPYWAGGMSYAEGGRGGNRGGGGGQGGNRGGGGRGGSSNAGGMSYEGGNSYARGRNARRDSMGRYSREGGYSYADEFESALQEAMSAAPNEQMREKLRRMMDEM